MGAVLQFPANERMEANNRMRELAFELNMQATLLSHIDPAEALLLTGQARGLLRACEIILEMQDA